jgi:hypothetical protein
MSYNYNKHSHANTTLANKSATLMLKSFFNPKSVLINTPIFQAHMINAGSAVQLKIQFFYYQSSRAAKLSNSSLNALISGLTKIYEGAYNRPVIIELEMVRQYRPYMNADILAHYLAINASKYGFNRMINFVLNAVPYIHPVDATDQNNAQSIQSISGVKIQLSGLLTSQRNRSRKTVYTASAGTFHSTSSTGSKTGMNIQYASHTTKSQLGSFTVKV